MVIFDCCLKLFFKFESFVYFIYGCFLEKDILIVVQLKDFIWLFGCILMRIFRELNVEEVERERDE